MEGVWILPAGRWTPITTQCLVGGYWSELLSEVRERFDFVIVDSLELDFCAGFTVLTGETGAGKSILLDAIAAVIGGLGNITGAVIGAVAGGVLGNQIGHGDGQTIATVAGAAAGGYAGSEVQKHIQKNNTTQSVEQRCRTVYDSVQKPDGYQVRYRLGDHEGTVRMDHDPGSSIPVANGELALNDSVDRR